jgi:hypothetical protein
VHVFQRDAVGGCRDWGVFSNRNGFLHLFLISRSTARGHIIDAHDALSPSAPEPANYQVNLDPFAITILKDERAGSACHAVHVKQKGALPCAVSSHSYRGYRVWDA